MHRINTPTALADKFGQGKNGYTDGDPATGRRATDLNANMFDSFQEEICNVIESGGLELDENKRDQLATAIKTLVVKTVEEAALLIAKNLKEIADSGSDAQKAARENIGLSNVNNVRAVQNGGGESMTPNNQVMIGWSNDRKALLQIDAQPQGVLFYERNPPTPQQVGALPVTGGSLTGRLTLAANSQLWTNNADGIRMTSGAYSVFFRQDGSNFYMMVTNPNDQGGTWNGLRPFRFNLANGAVTMSNGLISEQNIRIAWGGREATYQENGDIFGPMWGGSLGNFLNAAKVNDVRLAGRTQFGGWDGMCEAPASCVVNGIGDFGASNGYGQYAVLQRFINGGWYNVSHG